MCVVTASVVGRDWQPPHPKEKRRKKEKKGRERVVDWAAATVTQGAKKK